jgi:hypothetical protein
LCRETAIDSLVAYNGFGSKHNLVLIDTLAHDSLLSQVLHNMGQLEIPKIVRWTTLRNAFGIPNQAETLYFEHEQAIDKAVQSEVYGQMQNLMSDTLRILSETLPDFVTFNSSIVDQMQWERVSNVELTDGTSEAECDLFALTNEFCCNAILSPIIGSQFTESNELLATDLATFNRRYWALALGLPRLAPIQGLPGAALAQKRLLHKFTNMFRELTHPPVRRVPDDDESVSGEETDADIPTPITKLNDLFTKHDLPMAARAAITLKMIHEVFAEVVPLVFWTLIHIYSSSSGPGAESSEITPLEKIRQQAGKWAQAIQPPSIHPSFPAPPEIIYDSTSGATNPTTLPFLLSCINESRRLYNTSALTYQLKKSITLTETNTQDTWELDAGSYIDVGLSQSLINSSASIFPDPTTFKPDRFAANPTGPSSITFAADSAQPYKTALVVAIVTGVLQLWEIAPAPKKSFFEHLQEASEEAQMGAAALNGEEKAAKQKLKEKEREKKVGMWVMPKPVEGSCVKVPKGDVRVRIRRREGLPSRKIVRKV